MPSPTSYMTSEFQLGSGMGYETFFSGKANSVDLKEGTASSMEFIDKLEKYYAKGSDMVIIKDSSPNATHRFSVGTILEMLTINKFNTTMSTKLMFQRGGTIKTAKGTIRYNEGLWRQFRRGYIISYGKRGGITKEHIKKAL